MTVTWSGFTGIAIHSLVKRETLAVQYLFEVQSNFNPLPRKEGDGFCGSVAGVPLYFNPLPRKEGDSKYS